MVSTVGPTGGGQISLDAAWKAVLGRDRDADGEFVFIQGEGTLHGIPTAFYDLFRVKNDKLAEHWDVIEDEVTKQGSQSGLPMFGEEFSK